MFKAALSIFALALFSSVAVAQDVSVTHVGYTGTLSTLDGGLGGVVTVLNTTAIQISSYTLKDASAPALYWWGTTDGVLKDGFRISNMHVTMAATSNMIVIILDAGKTSSNFTTVGLWCEQLSANFGQATLKAPGASTASGTSAGSPSATGSAAAATSSKASAGNIMASSQGGMAMAFLVAVAFAAWMR